MAESKMQIEIDWDKYIQQLLDTIDQLREDNRKLCESVITLAGIVGNMWYSQPAQWDKWEITCNNNVSDRS